MTDPVQQSSLQVDECVCDGTERCAYHAAQVEPIMHDLARALRNIPSNERTASANAALWRYDLMEAHRETL